VWGNGELGSVAIDQGFTPVTLLLVVVDSAVVRNDGGLGLCVDWERRRARLARKVLVTVIV
jgi:hypothetical protein